MGRLQYGMLAIRVRFPVTPLYRNFEMSNVTLAHKRKDNSATNKLKQPKSTAAAGQSI